MAMKFFLVTLVVFLIAYELNIIYASENPEITILYNLAHANILERCKIATVCSTLRNVFGVFLKTRIPSNQNIVNVKNEKVNNLTMRVYSPKNNLNNSPLPVLVYIYGGGYFSGSLDGYDAFLYRLVEKVENLSVISIDYRKAPEHPYPIPTNDCFAVLKYIIDHPNDFNIDLNRLIIAGDSAGGNAAIVMQQMLLNEQSKFMPKLQILIYPWLHLHSHLLPSSLKFQSNFLKFTELIHWYLGYTNFTQEMEEAIYSQHINQFLEEEKQIEIKNYLDTELIQEEYKKGKSYYSKEFISQSISATTKKFDKSNSILSKDVDYFSKIKLIFNDDLSPGLMSDEKLKMFPNTYLIACEFDFLKDETLIFGERLKRAGVKNKVAFYETCLHGIIQMVDRFEFASKISDDLIEYIKYNI